MQRKSQDNKLNPQHLQDSLSKNKLLLAPDYLEINYNILEGIFIKSPSLDKIIYPISIDLTNVIQYYEYKRKV